jgi:hypothetical protein
MRAPRLALLLVAACWTGSTSSPRPAAPSPEVAAPPAAPRDRPTMTAEERDELVEEANRTYDRGDVEEARSVARRVLASEPANVRMLRIVVSASCMLGDIEDARAAFAKLPPHDRSHMKTRCARYGIHLRDP